MGLPEYVHISHTYIIIYSKQFATKSEYDITWLVHGKLWWVCREDMTNQWGHILNHQGPIY